ncbi:MAG: HNH endonuclease [Anaerolineae bacterium]|nr:HNH endonuclease [Anaerolineae bacterium]
MATSLLKRRENAIVVFTCGKYFKKRDDGSGSTGNWVIDKKRKVKQVIIYNRTERGNEVYVAKRTAVTPSKHVGRFVIELDSIEYYGCTYFNWTQFSGSRNPVRYWNRTLALGSNTLRCLGGPRAGGESSFQRSFS